MRRRPTPGSGRRAGALAALVAALALAGCGATPSASPVATAPPGASAQPSGPAPGAAAVTQVLYVLPGRGYVMTFAVPPARADAYAQAVVDIATSFTIRI